MSTLTRSLSVASLTLVLSLALSLVAFAGQSERRIVESENDFEGLIQEGCYIELFDGEMLITGVDGNQFDGLFRTWYPNVVSRALPKDLWSRIYGETVEGKVTFTIKSFDLRQRRFVEKEKGSFIYGIGHPFVLISTLKDKPGKSHVILHATQLSDDDLAAHKSGFNESVKTAFNRAQELMPKIDQLKARKHDIWANRALETGEIRISWSGMVTPRSPHGTSTLDSYEALKELADFPYIYAVTLDGLRRVDQLPPLKHLQHIGELRFYDYNGVGVETLKDGPKIDSLFINSANDKSIAGISQLKSLKAIQLCLGYHDRKKMTADNYELLANLPQLKHLYIQRVPDRDPDVLRRLSRLTQLESLQYHGKVTEAGLRALKNFKALRKLELFSLQSPEMLASIDLPKLERLKIEYGKELADQHLANWTMPPNLEHLQLPFWTPGLALQYAKRRADQTDEEKECYSLARTMISLSDAYKNSMSYQETLDRLELNLEVYGGFAKVDLHPADAHEALSQVYTSLSEIRSDRITHAQFKQYYYRQMPAYARALKKQADELYDKGVIGPSEVHSLEKCYASFVDK